MGVRHQHRSQPARTLLQWVFRHQDRMVTCQLEQQGNRFLVSLIPHRGLRNAIIGTFDAGLSAFQHHAEVAAELRRHGWMLVAYR
jgi:hypothetical protein